MPIENEKTLYVIVAGDHSEPEDEGVQGIYEVRVDGNLADGQQREAALDQFHDHVGIEMLEDFLIDVVDAEGNSLDVLDSYENGDLIDSADYSGSIMENEAPAPVAEAFRKLSSPSPAPR